MIQLSKPCPLPMIDCPPQCTIASYWQLRLTIHLATLAPWGCVRKTMHVQSICHDSDYNIIIL